MFGDREPSEFSFVLFRGDQFDQFRSARVVWQSAGGEGQAPVGCQWASDDRLAGCVGVNAVGSESEVRIGLAGFGDGILHRTVDIEYCPAAIALLQQPLRVGF